MKLTVGELRSLRAIAHSNKNQNKARWLEVYCLREYENLEPDVCEYLRDWAFPSRVFGDRFRSKFTDEMVNQYIEFNIPADPQLAAMFMLGYSVTHKHLYDDIASMNVFREAGVGKAILFRASQFLSTMGYTNMDFEASGHAQVMNENEEYDRDRWGHNWKYLTDIVFTDYCQPVRALMRLLFIHEDLSSDIGELAASSHSYFRHFGTDTYIHISYTELMFFTGSSHTNKVKYTHMQNLFSFPRIGGNT